MAIQVVLQTSSTRCSNIWSSSAHLCLEQRFHDGSSPQVLALSSRQVLGIRKELGTAKAQTRENNITPVIQFRKSIQSPFQVDVKACGRFSDAAEDSSSASSDIERKKNEDESITDSPIIWNTLPEKQQEGTVLSSSTGTHLQALTQDVAMGLVLRETARTSWTTGSGLEGPAGEVENEGKEELKFPDLSKSPRRKMRVAFTCNVCGERTIRAINPLAYTGGTVFVQCKGCDAFHKLVDNLNLFHEMRGKIFRGYDIPWYANDQPHNFLDGQYPLL